MNLRSTGLNLPTVFAQATTIAALRSRIAGADQQTRRAIVEAVVPLDTGSIRLNPDYTFSIHGVLPVITNAPAPVPEPVEASTDEGADAGDGEGSPESAVGTAGSAASTGSTPVRTNDYMKSAPRPR